MAIGRLFGPTVESIYIKSFWAGDFKMVYQGTVRGGVVVLESGARLPEGLTVTVQPLGDRPRPFAASDSPTTTRNGVPIFASNAMGPTPGLDLVNQLRDETP